MKLLKKGIAYNIYLYSCWRGPIKLYKGTVYLMEGHDDVGIFFNHPESDLEKKRYLCSSKEGVVYNSVVWLKTENESHAKELLIAYLRNKIKDFNEQISSLLEKIDNVEASTVERRI